MIVLILQLTQLFETFVVTSYPSCLRTSSGKRERNRERERERERERLRERDRDKGRILVRSMYLFRFVSYYSFSI